MRRGYKQVIKYVPTITEHPSDYYGVPFIASVDTRSGLRSVIFDNIDHQECFWYDLSRINLLMIEPERFFGWVDQWWTGERDIPLSVFFSKHNLINFTQILYQVVEKNSVKSINGPINYYSMIYGGEDHEFVPGARSVGIKRRAQKVIRNKVLNAQSNLDLLLGKSSSPLI